MYIKAASKSRCNTSHGGEGAGPGNPSVDDLLGNVPGTTDCWASAGCSGYDPGSGAYTDEGNA